MHSIEKACDITLYNENMTSVTLDDDKKNIRFSDSTLTVLDLGDDQSHYL